MAQPTLLPHATAILDRLRGWAPLIDANVAIGDHVAPKSTTGDVVSPAAILYLRPGGEISGALGCPDVDAWLPFQLTCVGNVAAQAMFVADLCHQALTATPLVVAGRRIDRLARTFFGASAQRDDDVTPPLFYVPAEYRLYSLEDAA